MDADQLRESPERGVIRGGRKASYRVEKLVVEDRGQNRFSEPIFMGRRTSEDDSSGPPRWGTSGGIGNEPRISSSRSSQRFKSANNSCVEGGGEQRRGDRDRDKPKRGGEEGGGPFPPKTRTTSTHGAAGRGALGGALSARASPFWTTPARSPEKKGALSARGSTQEERSKIVSEALYRGVPVQNIISGGNGGGGQEDRWRRSTRPSRREERRRSSLRAVVIGISKKRNSKGISPKTTSSRAEKSVIARLRRKSRRRGRRSSGAPGAGSEESEDDGEDEDDVSLDRDFLQGESYPVIPASGEAGITEDHSSESERGNDSDADGSGEVFPRKMQKRSPAKKWLMLERRRADLDVPRRNPGVDNHAVSPLQQAAKNCEDARKSWSCSWEEAGEEFRATAVTPSSSSHARGKTERVRLQEHVLSPSVLYNLPPEAKSTSAPPVKGSKSTSACSPSETPVANCSPLVQGTRLGRDTSTTPRPAKSTSAAPVKSTPALASETPLGNASCSPLVRGTRAGRDTSTTPRPRTLRSLSSSPKRFHSPSPLRSLLESKPPRRFSSPSLGDPPPANFWAPRRRSPRPPRSSSPVVSRGSPPRSGRQDSVRQEFSDGGHQDEEIVLEPVPNPCEPPRRAEPELVLEPVPSTFEPPRRAPNFRGSAGNRAGGPPDRRSSVDTVEVDVAAESQSAADHTTMLSQGPLSPPPAPSAAKTDFIPKRVTCEDQKEVAPRVVQKRVQLVTHLVTAAISREPAMEKQTQLFQSFIKALAAEGFVSGPGGQGHGADHVVRQGHVAGQDPVVPGRSSSRTASGVKNQEKSNEKTSSATSADVSPTSPMMFYRELEDSQPLGGHQQRSRGTPTAVVDEQMVRQCVQSDSPRLGNLEEDPGGVSEGSVSKEQRLPTAGVAENQFSPASPKHEPRDPDSVTASVGTDFGYTGTGLGGVGITAETCSPTGGPVAVQANSNLSGRSPDDSVRTDVGLQSFPACLSPRAIPAVTSDMSEVVFPAATEKVSASVFPSIPNVPPIAGDHHVGEEASFSGGPVLRGPDPRPSSLVVRKSGPTRFGGQHKRRGGSSVTVKHYHYTDIHHHNVIVDAQSRAEAGHQPPHERLHPEISEMLQKFQLSGGDGAPPGDFRYAPSGDSRHASPPPVGATEYYHIGSPTSAEVDGVPPNNDERQDHDVVTSGSPSILEEEEELYSQRRAASSPTPLVGLEVAAYHDPVPHDAQLSPNVLFPPGPDGGPPSGPGGDSTSGLLGSDVEEEDPPSVVVSLTSGSSIECVERAGERSPAQFEEVGDSSPGEENGVSARSSEDGTKFRQHLSSDGSASERGAGLADRTEFLSGGSASETKSSSSSTMDGGDLDFLSIKRIGILQRRHKPSADGGGTGATSSSDDNTLMRRDPPAVPTRAGPTALPSAQQEGPSLKGKLGAYSPSVSLSQRTEIGGVYSPSVSLSQRTEIVLAQARLKERGDMEGLHLQEPTTVREVAPALDHREVVAENADYSARTADSDNSSLLPDRFPNRDTFRALLGPPVGGGPRSAQRVDEWTEDRGSRSGSPPAPMYADYRSGGGTAGHGACEDRPGPRGASSPEGAEGMDFRIADRIKPTRILQQRPHHAAADPLRIYRREGGGILSGSEKASSREQSSSSSEECSRDDSSAKDSTTKEAPKDARSTTTSAGAVMMRPARGANNGECAPQRRTATDRTATLRGPAPRTFGSAVLHLGGALAGGQKSEDRGQNSEDQQSCSTPGAEEPPPRRILASQLQETLRERLMRRRKEMSEKDERDGDAGARSSSSQGVGTKSVALLPVSGVQRSIADVTEHLLAAAFSPQRRRRGESSSDGSPEEDGSPGDGRDHSSGDGLITRPKERGEGGSSALRSSSSLMSPLLEFEMYTGAEDPRRIGAAVEKVPEESAGPLPSSEKTPSENSLLDHVRNRSALLKKKWSSPSEDAGTLAGTSREDALSASGQSLSSSGGLSGSTAGSFLPTGSSPGQLPVASALKKPLLQSKLLTRMSKKKRVTWGDERSGFVLGRAG